MMRGRSILCAALLAAGGIALSVTPISAEQIQLSNGRFIQGEIISTDDQGFRFKMVETGGEVFLRWSQVHADDRDRIQNVQDPDADLQDVFVVRTKGDRIELISGEIYEGKITYDPSYKFYTVSNARYSAYKIEEEDVLEDSYKQGVDIDASNLLEPAEILALKQEQSPPESAQDYYELARLAEHLGLYRDSKSFIEECLAASDVSANLSDVAEGWNATLDELIRNETLLQVATQARELARKRKFQPALDGIRELVEQAELSGKIKDEMDRAYNEIDEAYTEYVADEWFDKARKLISKNCKKDYSEFSEALGFVRGQVDQFVMAEIAEEVGNEEHPAEPQQIYQRFLSRLEGLKDDPEKMKKLKTRRADFGKNGWYELVGGNIPNGGNMQQPNNGNGNGNGNNGNFPNGFPRRDRDGVDDASDGFQDRGGRGGNGGGGQGASGEIDPADIVGEIIKRMGEGGGSSGGDGGIDDLTKPEMPEPPENRPAITVWWEDESWTKRKNWLMAYYVYSAAQRNAVLIIEQKKLSHRIEYY